MLLQATAISFISFQVLCLVTILFSVEALMLEVLRCQQDKSPEREGFVLFNELLSLRLLLILGGGGTGATCHWARHICRDNLPPNCSGGATTFVSGNLPAVIFLASIISKYPVRIIHTFFVSIHFEFI